MKVRRAWEIRDVYGQGKWAIKGNTQIPDTWREKDERELLEEKSEIRGFWAAEGYPLRIEFYKHWG